MSSCFHCALKFVQDDTWSTLVGEEKRLFCCPACLAVHQCIQGGGFEMYYERRSSMAETPNSEAMSTEFESLDLLLSDLPFVTKDESIASAKLLVEGIHCSACAWLIESVVSAVDGVDAVQVNLRQGHVKVSWRLEDQKLSVIMRAINALGYVASGWCEQARTKAYAVEKSELQRRLGVAGLLMMQVGMLSLGLYAGDWQSMDPATQNLLRLASFLLATISLLYCAAPFFRSALRAVYHTRVNMDVPIVIALGVAYTVSAHATVLGGELVYFDTVCMFVFFLLLSRFMETLSRQPSTVSAAGLIPIIALKRSSIDQSSSTVDSQKEALTLEFGKEESDSQLQPMLSKDLKVGDIILSRGGEAVCADGVIVDGHSCFDESAFTGESSTVNKLLGDSVLAGSVNCGDSVWVKVSRTANESSIAHIDRLIDAADASKPFYAQLIDRLSPWFIVTVLTAAAVTASIWLVIDPSMALSTSLAVLIVSCPCALALATPLALAEAHKAARNAGIVPFSGRFLQVLPYVTDIVFDKTGTLTESTLMFSVDSKSAESNSNAIKLAASLEVHSLHPIASALRSVADEAYLPVTAGREVLSYGVEGCIAGKSYRFGKPSWSSEKCSAEVSDTLLGAADCLLCDEQKVLASFSFSESLRTDARACVEALLQGAYQIHLLSGDTEPKVKRVARLLSVGNVCAEASPENKLDYIHDLQARGKTVLMIGDGVNDAPVLSSADVSIAMHGAADISKSRADAVLIKDSLMATLFAFRLADSAKTLVLQNITWAAAYNLISIPMAAFGFLPPWAAAIGMSLSSLVVIFNSKRLSRIMDQSKSARERADGQTSAEVRQSIEQPLVAG
ncbi:MAG: heavy metal translocating P-type ATPase [Pseudomonadales bacterium]